jgi:hypothetical protein
MYSTILAKFYKMKPSEKLSEEPQISLFFKNRPLSKENGSANTTDYIELQRRLRENGQRFENTL